MPQYAPVLFQELLLPLPHRKPEQSAPCSPWQEPFLPSEWPDNYHIYFFPPFSFPFSYCPKFLISVFMAGHQMSWLCFPKQWNFLSASLFTPRAAVMEPASTNGAGLYAGICHDLVQCFYSRVRYRNGRDQHFCIRMQRIGIELIRVCDFHKISQI